MWDEGAKDNFTRSFLCLIEMVIQHSGDIDKMGRLGRLGRLGRWEDGKMEERKMGRWEDGREKVVGGREW